MPFINVYISQKLDDKKKKALTEEISAAVSILPAITAEKAVINLHEACHFYRMGEKEDNAFMEMRLRHYEDSTLEKKTEMVEELYRIFTKILDLSNDKIQFNIIELENWGSRGRYR